MPLWSPRFAMSAALVVFVAGGAFAATREDQIVQLKRMQTQILIREPAERLGSFEARQKKHRHGEASKTGSASARRGGVDRLMGERWRRLDQPTDLEMAERAAGLRSGTSGRTSIDRISGLSSIETPPNRLMNNPTGEPDGSCQSEVSIATHDTNLVATWNDGIGIYGQPTSPTNDTQGFGYSTNGGLTWTDGGAVPNDGTFVWSSDPVVVVNDETGAFYYCALIDSTDANGDVSNTKNGIAVIKGTFTGSSFSWGAPVHVRMFPNTSNLIDKQWMAVDPLTGNLYLTFSNFTIVGGVTTSNSIQFMRSVNDGQTWSAPITLSAGSDAGLVQGSRPAVGPTGEIYTVWHAIGRSDPSDPGRNSPYGRDFL
ncbi:MAG: exo-alpha-sialidase, partial [Candidatus Eisenbacteria bacterium]